MKEGVIHTSTLTVVNVSAALDYAVFTCIARNSLGEDTLDIQLLSTSMHIVHRAHTHMAILLFSGDCQVN